MSISGFSKFSKEKKIEWLIKNHFNGNIDAKKILKSYWNEDKKLQQLHDEFTENCISNFYMPFGIAPNFLINDKFFTIPMAIEESSVVAAASNAAKFWMSRGGFKTHVRSTTKVGHVHFLFKGNEDNLIKFYESIKSDLIKTLSPLTNNMKSRGGGIQEIKLVNCCEKMNYYYQIEVNFDTCDAMGANFINSCLEKIADELKKIADEKYPIISKNLEIIMSILSNYVPNCIVHVEVSCPVNDLNFESGLDGKEFAEKFVQAVKIAEVDTSRAVTHNKGIMNGVDSVIIATGNDFRAIEAGVHAYASKDGNYTSLSHAQIKNKNFKFWMELPLALGTVGGLTSLHPMVKLALDLLDNPSAEMLMEIVAAAGLAQNFAAVKSLITTGIQKGHMKMHLLNILNNLQADQTEKDKLKNHFKFNIVSHNEVVKALAKLRKND